jgi:hypothetical protein
MSSLHFRILLQDHPDFFNYFSKDSGRVLKTLKNIFAFGFQNARSHTFQTYWCLKVVFTNEHSTR